MSEVFAPLAFVGFIAFASIAWVLVARTRFASTRRGGRASHHSAEPASASVDTTADAVARRLGLRFLRGDPYLDLAAPGSAQGDLRLEGTPHGRTTSLSYVFRTRDTTSLGQALLGGDVTEVEHAARIEVESRARRGRFEIRHVATGGLDARSVFDPHDPLPRRRFGTNDDERLVIHADDVEVPARLAAHLGPLLTLGYVHVAGEFGRVWFEMACSSHGWQGTRIAARYGFGRVDEVVRVLAAMADALEE